MRIGVTGASGMLGTALIACLSESYEIFATSRHKGIESDHIEWDCFDLTDIVLLKKWLNKVKPNILVHCAAITNVDICEDVVNLAKQLHVKTTEVIVDYSENNNTRLIYISTDQVFDGKKQVAYIESDLVNPLNVYAKTKLMAEKLVQSMDNGLVLRVNIIGWTQEGKSSFAEWILNSLVNNLPLNLFHDVYFSPISIYHLSLVIEKIIEQPLFGLYNCASSESISKYDFGKKMAEIFQLSDLNINRVSMDIMPFKANRPKNLSLDVNKISTALNCDLPGVEDSLKLMKYQYDNIGNILN